MIVCLPTICEAFLASDRLGICIYFSVGPQFGFNPLFDLACLPGWNVFGVIVGVLWFESTFHTLNWGQILSMEQIKK